MGCLRRLDVVVSLVPTMAPMVHFRLLLLAADASCSFHNCVQLDQSRQEALLVVIGVLFQFSFDHFSTNDGSI